MSDLGWVVAYQQEKRRKHRVRRWIGGLVVAAMIAAGYYGIASIKVPNCNVPSQRVHLTAGSLHWQGGLCVDLRQTNP